VCGKLNSLERSNFWQKGDFGCIMSPMQMPRQLQTLDDLLAQAEHYAEFCMRNSGKTGEQIADGAERLR
jgi:hypothetical protein